MPFALLVLATALFIEGIGTYISILGLSALFAGSLVVVIMAVALDVGKVVCVSFVYKHWQNINWLMKTYMTIATFVLMVITSAGVFGFLSGEFQKAIAGNNQAAVQITALEDEQTRLQARKQEIDAQIANLPANYVNSRVRLANQFKEETSRLNARLAEIDTQLPQLKIDTIGQSVKIGPIIYVSEAFDTTPELAVKWVILVIIFVFDPLAVVLLIAGNYLLAQRTLNKKKNAAFDEAVRTAVTKPATVIRPHDETFHTRSVATETIVQPAKVEPAPVVEVELPEAPLTQTPAPSVDVEEDIITMEKIKTPVQKRTMPIPRSSLEGIDTSRVDLSITTPQEVPHTPISEGDTVRANKIYAAESVEDAARVGGPTYKKDSAD